MEEDDVMECIDFDVVDSFIDCGATTPTEDCEIEILVGFEFSSIEEVQDLYARYGKFKGFQIRRRNSREKIVQFVCYREGFHKPRNKENGIGVSNPQTRQFTKTCKIGCRASLYCSFDDIRNVWKIIKFSDEHNHHMVSPKSRKYLRTHKKVSALAKCLTQVFANEGIPICKVTNVLNPNPDEAEFTRKDCYNYITSVRKRILDCGDAQAVYHYCSCQQELNPNFRFAIQLDDEDRMLNFFWVDARSRVAYQIFGDVVSFDTTYKTNKYSMPFAPFVGIDNHKHTILFGCAFLQDETEATFVWLFNAWLKAMEGKTPSAIITDQDAAIMNVVARVFPSAKHHLCIWHIMKKFPERLSHIYHDKSSFKSSLNQCIYGSLSIDEFEDSWKRLVIEFGLVDNEWLRSLFSIRHMWVPIFCKDVFFGGMNTTGRSESINVFFDGFVHSGTTLKEFVEKYGQTLESRYEGFRRAEYDTMNKLPIYTLGMGLEEHAGLVYTSEIFKEFHAQLSQLLSYNREVILDGDSIKFYRVKNRLSKGKNFMVEFDIYTHTSKCECMLFEFEGILCRHILVVFYMHNVEQIPSQYVLSCWTKEVGRILWESPIGREKQLTTSIDRFNLRLMFDDLDAICEQSKNLQDDIVRGTEVLLAAAKSRLEADKIDGVHAHTYNIDANNPSVQQSSPSVQDPNVSQTKGRKKASTGRSSRFKSGLELSVDASVR